LRLAPSLLCAALVACGYRPLYGGEAPLQLHVRLVRTLIPDAVASDEVASGVREELARGGALKPGDGYPCVEIEVLREGESSEDIAAEPNGPIARGTGAAIVARAWIVRAQGAEREGDTGDLRSEVVIASEAAALNASAPGASADEVAARSNAFHFTDALRAAARRLGIQLARKVSGLPAASDDAFETP
jgi:hypothetical protein